MPTYVAQLQDADQWIAFGNAGSDGDIDATSGTVTIDSIWLAGTSNAQIYFDNVMHNPIGLITPGYIPGDFDGDGLVNAPAIPSGVPRTARASHPGPALMAMAMASSTTRTMCCGASKCRCPAEQASAPAPRFRSRRLSC
jgi:hypothetical protein